MMQQQIQALVICARLDFLHFHIFFKILFLLVLLSNIGQKYIGTCITQLADSIPIRYDCLPNFATWPGRDLRSEEHTFLGYSVAASGFFSPHVILLLAGWLLLSTPITFLILNIL